MLILHLSDTHSKHHELHNLPNADIIIHSGNITFAGPEKKLWILSNGFVHYPTDTKYLLQAITMTVCIT